MNKLLSMLVLTFFILANAHAKYADALMEQRVFNWHELQKQQKRLDQISYNLLRASSGFCTDHTVLSMGIRVANADSLSVPLTLLYGYNNEFNKYATKDLNASLTIRAVLKNSPAQKAGLKIGDVIDSVNGIKIPEGSKAFKEYSEALKNISSPVKLGIIRKNKKISYSVKAEAICNYRISVGVGSPNISSTLLSGNYHIVITSGAMNAYDNDSLVILIAHEIVHNLQGDRLLSKALAKGFLNLATDAVLPISIGDVDEYVNKGARSKREHYADYVGLHMAANAGADITKAKDMWLLLYFYHYDKSSTINHATQLLHPLAKNKFAQLKKTIDEIKNKKSKGISLIIKVRKKKVKNESDSDLME